MVKQRLTIKNHLQEVYLVSRRVFIASGFILLCVSILLLRLAYLQIEKHTFYQTLSDRNQIDIRPTQPARGLIYDRHAKLLATNVPVYSLDVTPSKTDDLWESIEEIKSIISLSEAELIQFKHAMNQKRPFDEMPLKLKLTETEVATFSVNQYRFPGFEVRARLIRDYPLGASFAHVLGHVGRINDDELTMIDATNYSANNYIGKVGLEKYYEQQLHGKVGYEKIEVDARGKMVRKLTDTAPVSGDNLYLTIDSTLQEAAQKALGQLRGAIVAIEPSTGEVLALVSNPSYDPNLFVTGISTVDYRTLQDDLDKPLYNRAIRGLYPIGSTIKPFLALAALNDKVIDPDKAIFDPGWYKLPNNGHVFHDWLHTGHGMVDMRKAIGVSCDTYFYELARRLGIERIDYYLTAFGFGQLTDIDMGEELPGNIPTPAWKEKMHGQSWYEGDTILTGIGQSYVQITPLNLAAGVAVLATRGVRYRPHLVKSIESLYHQKVDIQAVEEPPIIFNNTSDWDVVIGAMEDVIKGTYGTGYRFGRNPGYTVAAKTGTAQVVSLLHAKKVDGEIPEKYRDHSVFIGFAPVNHPEIALAVIVENNHDASKIAREVMDEYLITEKNYANI